MASTTTLTKEEQLLRDIKHLATDIINLSGGRSAQDDIRVAVELAQTAWHKLRDLGQVRGPWDFFRALDGGQVEWLTSYEDCAIQNSGRVCNMLEMSKGHHLSMWLYLESAGLCTAEEFATARAACSKPTADQLNWAEQRWSQAQAELEEEGTLPLHRPQQLLASVKIVAVPATWPMKDELRWSCQVCGRQMGYTQSISVELSALLVGTFVKYHNEHCGQLR